MANNHTEFFEQALKALENCGETLGKVTASCCMPERSPKMTQAFDTLQVAVFELQHGNKDQASLAKCIDNIEQCGSQVGRLYVTCCTDTRAPLYQQMLKQLNSAYEKLGQLTGHSH